MALRNLGSRPNLPALTLTKLSIKTSSITAIAADAAKVNKAKTIYKSSRGVNWFRPVVDALRGLSGPGEFCMYCSANEPTHLDHYKPIAHFPESAMTYENFLWTCDICNHVHKQDRFPPKTETGEPILNPIDDNVWEHFIIDEVFGRLIPRIDANTRLPFPRAESTRRIVGIDRETVQVRRQKRFTQLKAQVEQLIKAVQENAVPTTNLAGKIQEMTDEPYQIDVADYYLKGTGKEREPFKTLFVLAETSTL